MVLLGDLYVPVPAVTVQCGKDSSIAEKWNLEIVHPR